MPSPSLRAPLFRSCTSRGLGVLAGLLATLAPTAASAASPVPDPFVSDPVTDLGVLSVAIGFSALLEIIIGTGELAPQQPISTSRLSWIDRPAVTRHIDPDAPMLSNYGAGAALLFAVAAPVFTGFQRSGKAGLVEATLYAQSLALTWSVTNLAKIAVRRPRPLAYQRQEELKREYGDKAPNIAETDTALSFFSGHTAFTSTVTATATYMAFVRAPGTARPWVTLSTGSLLTAFVGLQRIRAGRHFPTDVIAGALAGAGIGVLVPHLHRATPSKLRGTTGDTSSTVRSPVFAFDGTF